MSIWSSADASRAAVACRGALPAHRVHHLLPQQAGDHSGTSRGKREHYETYEVRCIVPGVRAVIEEKTALRR